MSSYPSKSDEMRKDVVDVDFLERSETASDKDGLPAVTKSTTVGTVTISDSQDIYLIPFPSADPRDPLNMPIWRKRLLVVLLSIFSSVGLTMVSGFGGLLGFYIPGYVEKGATFADITALMTYPTMFMGVGNLICMPLALAVGRRPVYLASCLILILGGVLAANSKDYEMHLGVRMLLGVGAGNSEALVPMMIQEVHFIHERSTFLMWQVAGQTIMSALLGLFASPIAGAIGPGNWYILGTGLSAAVFVVSFFLVPETRYTRPLEAYQQEGAESSGSSEVKAMRISQRPALDFSKYEARTIWSDMRIFVGDFDWTEGSYSLKNTFQILLFPGVMWAFCLNGFTLGVNIAIATTYGSIVTAAPYNWPDKYASYVNTSQIVVALIALPLLGNGSDYLIKWRARRNGGVHEPEARLLLLWIPIVIAVVSSVIYGLAAAHPEDYHWFAIVFSFGGYYFGFVGANIAGITYLLDSYPARSGPVLVVITALRGFVSFGTSYGVATFIETAGYDGSFGAYAGITAFLGLLGIPIYFYGKQLREFTGKWAVKERTGKPSMAR